jgi:hypothetical protein
MIRDFLLENFHIHEQSATRKIQPIRNRIPACTETCISDYSTVSRQSTAERIQRESYNQEIIKLQGILPEAIFTDSKSVMGCAVRFRLKRKLNKIEAKLFLLRSDTEGFVSLRSETADFRCETKGKQSETDSKKQNETKQNKTKPIQGETKLKKRSKTITHRNRKKWKCFIISAPMPLWLLVY